MTSTTTDQMEKWKGGFGRAYTDRTTFSNIDQFNQIYVQRYGRSRDDLCRDWLHSIPATSRILEVGSSVGYQLMALKRIGFENLFGIEIQRYCVDKAKELAPGVDIIEGSAFDIPFKDGFFDLVFTNNVLIHFAPPDLPAAFDEMHRVTNRFVWGFEYYASETTEVSYRGNQDLLWKADYPRMFAARFADIRVSREEIYDCLDEPGNADKAYLLEKTS